MCVSSPCLQPNKPLLPIHLGSPNTVSSSLTNKAHQVGRPKLGVETEVSLHHAVKVLDGIENAGLLSGVGVMLHVEDWVALNEEVMELHVVFTTEGCWGF
jgi:hypothetical protein